MSPSKLRGLIAIPLLLGLTLVSLLWLRPAPPAPDATVASAAGDLPPGSAAMRATINPETGELEVRAGMPDLSLDPATKQALRRDAEGLTPIYHPDGSVSVNLQGRFQSASVARLDEDGRVIVCSEHADEVNAALAGDEAVSAPKAVVR